MRVYGIGFALLACAVAAQAVHAETTCRAVQVTCAPEVGLLSLRTLDYKVCESTPKQVQQLRARGIFPIPEKDAPITTSTCHMGMGEVKVALSGYVENGNPQGHCGAYGAVPVIDLWLDGKQLIRSVPIQSCRTEPSYNAEEITLSEDLDSYSILFGGNINVKNNYYPFSRHTNQPEDFPLPITKGMILGKEQDAYGK